MTEASSGAPPTVADAIALAEGWIERAALLATLAYDVTELFHGTEDRPAPFVIKRLTGGATTADPRNVEHVRIELMLAAEQARDAARRILDAVSEAPVGAVTPALGGDRETAPPLRDPRFEILTGGDEIEPNPLSPRAQRWDHAAGLGLADDLFDEPLSSHSNPHE
jgi:hypothetical protein